MKFKKISTLSITAILSISLLSGCSSSNTSSSSASSSNTAVASSSSAQQENTAEKNKKDGEQLLSDLEGTYEELFPVICADTYDQVWTDDAAKLVQGKYAYWMASGIPVDADEQMAKDAINLFCTENLSNSEK